MSCLQQSETFYPYPLNIMSFRLFFGVALLSVGALTCSHATLLIQENFDYTPDQPLGGQAGGTGWSGAWSGSTPSITVVNPTLGYGDLITDGGHVRLSANTDTVRSLARPYGGSGTDIWISFLIDAGGAGQGVSLLLGDRELAFFGTPSGVPTGHYGALFPFAGQQAIDLRGSISASGANLMVIRMNQTGRAPIFKAWLNPDLESLRKGVEPARATGAGGIVGAEFTYLTFNAIRLARIGGPSDAQIDELRIATHPGALVDIPELATGAMVMGAMGALLVLTRRRRV